MNNREFAGIQEGIRYFLIHLSLEFVCYYFLMHVFSEIYQIWMIYLAYDVFAFAFQSVIGKYFDQNGKGHPGIIGYIMCGTAVTIGLRYTSLVIPCMVIMAIGNGFVHISGAIVTLKASKGGLTSVAIFVGGGAVGVFLGKNFSDKNLIWLIVVITLIAIKVMKMKDKKWFEDTSEDNNVTLYDYVIGKHAFFSIVLMFFVIVIRSYMGYGIPMYWNQSILTQFILCIALCVGKAVGGVFSDIFGAKKVAMISTILSFPLVLLGGNHMVISILGIMLFSMTMSITLGAIVSILPGAYGFAFGITTFALLIGSLPAFFGVRCGNITLGIATILSVCIFGYVLKGKQQS